VAEAYVEGVFFAAAELETEARAGRLAYLEKVARQLGSDLSIQCCVLEGDVVGALCAHAASEGVDLVVMATHARGPLSRFWLGSTADEMVRQAPMPILLVRPEDEKIDLTLESVPTRVILPLDGTELAEHIIEPAVELAELMPGVEFTLVRVIRPVAPLYGVPDLPVADQEAHALLSRVQEMQEQLCHEGENYLEKVAERLRFRGLSANTRVAIDENPAAAILREANAVGAGLIALETHGRRGLARLMMGSVTDKVVRGAHVPVLVQRPVHA